MTDDANTDLSRAVALRTAGLRVTRPRLAVLAALAERPHARTDEVLVAVRREVRVSTQAVYDVLAALTARDLVRRIQPAGSLPRYELRTGDNHHHLVCRACGAVADVDCEVGRAPCVVPGGLDDLSPGFALDEAEVTFWGVCAACRAQQRDDHPTAAPDRTDPTDLTDRPATTDEGVLT